jgi:hypothetical protein
MWFSLFDLPHFLFHPSLKIVQNGPRIVCANSSLKTAEEVAAAGGPPSGGGRKMAVVADLNYRDLYREEIRECVEEVTPGFYRWIGRYDDKTHRGIQHIMRDPADLYVGD